MQIPMPAPGFQVVVTDQVSPDVEMILKHLAGESLDYRIV